MTFEEFLSTSYTPYHAVENAVRMLEGAGFTPLGGDCAAGGKYYTVRGGSLIAFRLGRGDFKIVASHTDSPCLKLKEEPAIAGEFTRLNTEPYGGGLWYTFFDRPLKIAGRTVVRRNGKLVPVNYASGFNVVLPSLAIHMDREANEKFAPNLQTELPVLSLGKTEWKKIAGEAVSYDLFAVPAQTPFISGANGEFLSSPRIDNLTGMYYSVCALIRSYSYSGTIVAACLEAEEIGSRTFGGAGSDFLRTALKAVSPEGDLSRSFLISLDNAHSLHPNHPEKCDPTNRAIMGKGVVIKGHAGGAYTTDALTSAVLKELFQKHGVPFQTFYNRSDLRSGSTLGAISLGQAGIPSADMGLAQLAMHSAVETVARADLEALSRALDAFYGCDIRFDGEGVTVRS